VTQTSYEQPACSSCGTGAAIQQSETRVIERSPTESTSEQTFDTSANGAPGIDPQTNVPLQREEQKPPVNGTPDYLQPLPGDDTTEPDPYDTKKTDNSTYFQAPKLFDPNDRTAQRGVAPVTRALYQKPVSYRNVSTARPITAEQAQQDAIGWTSASK
jgi:hypothetical protein